VPKFAQRSFNYIPDKGGDEGAKEVFREADSQTFVKGDLVRLDGNGHLVIVATTGIADILGIAEQPATNVTAGHARITVQMIRRTDQFSCNYESGQTFAETDIGNIFDITRTSAGNWEVQKSSATDAWVKILGSLEGPDGAGAYNAAGPVKVRFLSAKVTGGGAGSLQFEDDTAD
jgi:hypothetical protein